MTDVVKRALDNYEYGANLPVKKMPPGRWETFSKYLDGLIRGVETPKQALDAAEWKIPFTHPMKPTKAERILWENLGATEFPWFMEEVRTLGPSPHTASISKWKNGKSTFTAMYLWHMRSMMLCLTHVPDIDTVLEIGGGYGALARLWLLNKIRPAKKYIIVDIPQSLFFAECALSLDFDDIGYFRDTMPDNKIVLVPVGNLEKIKTGSDIVVNLGSMQEMSDAWADHYMTFLDSYDCKWFYSLNYCGSPIWNMAECRSFWAPRPSPKWTTRLINPDPPLVKAMCQQRYFAEHLYEKVPSRASVKDWSVYRGHKLTRATYIEGIDLIRLSTDPNETAQFFNTVLHSNKQAVVQWLPKELYTIATSLEHANLPKAHDVRKILEEQIGGWTQ